MHFSQITICAGVLSFLQAVTARPVVDGIISESAPPGAAPSTTEVNTVDGEVVSTANGTEIQTFPNTTTGSSGTSGTTWSFRYLGSSLPVLQTHSPIVPSSKLVITMSHTAAT